MRVRLVPWVDLEVMLVSQPAAPDNASRSNRLPLANVQSLHGLSTAFSIRYQRMSVSSEVPLRLEHLSVIDATGSDAESFLQGQFCNDLGELATPGAQLTGYCSPKGRLLATPVLQRLNAGFRLVVSSDLAEAFLQRLRMFVMRSDVIFTVRDDMACIAVFNDSDAIFASVGASAPSELMGLTVSDEASVMRWNDSSEARWLVIAPLAALGELDVDASQVWRLADIRAGMPFVVDATREAFVPQMMNLAEVGGLSFTKGCYPGQEIVARTKYLGKLKKHMLRFVADAGELPVAGQTLGDAGTPDAGEVIDAVALEGGGIELLAVVRIERDAQAPLPLVGGSAVPASLPYEPPGAASETESA